eukprot:TRINITY_DN5285_c1_g1_i2.p1 TRINITY_DN5285_c1_g1~~TRINITY_DN5285_c1_g1_i2.p1  ORF type:complete len:277 (-),score=-27.98 TRINITY_DN5285_c1_g1_i2:443-1273(-)
MILFAKKIYILIILMFSVWTIKKPSKNYRQSAWIEKFACLSAIRINEGLLKKTKLKLLWYTIYNQHSIVEAVIQFLLYIKLQIQKVLLQRNLLQLQLTHMYILLKHQIIFFEQYFHLIKNAMFLCCELYHNRPEMFQTMNSNVIFREYSSQRIPVKKSNTKLFSRTHFNVSDFLLINNMIINNLLINNIIGSITVSLQFICMHILLPSQYIIDYDMMTSKQLFQLKTSRFIESNDQLYTLIYIYLYLHFYYYKQHIKLQNTWPYSSIVQTTVLVNR